MSDAPLSMAFWLIAELCTAAGVAPLTKHRGCVEVTAGAWTITVNGHARPKRSRRGLFVPRFSALLEFNGWPAGSMNPFGGIVAAGEAANEDTLIAALRAEVLRLTGRDVVAEMEAVEQAHG